MIVQRLLLVAMVATLASFACAQTPANLLSNPGFETQEAAGAPSPWSFAGKGSLVRDAKLAHSGQACARVRFEDCAIQTVAVEPDAWYLVEGFVRAEKPDCDEVPRIKVNFDDAAGRPALTSGGFIEKTSYRDWQPFRIVLHSPEQAATMGLRLIGQFNGAEWFYFDDLRMVALPVSAWPLPETLPDLHNQTVVVPYVAEIKSFALYRVPPLSFAPVDGLQRTAAWTGRSRNIKYRPPTCDFDLCFGKPTAVNWLLIHAISPDEPLGEARLFAPGTEGKPLATLTANDQMVHSVRFSAQPLEGLRLRLYGTDQRTALLQEMQAFGLRPGLATGGQSFVFSNTTPTAEEQQALAAVHANNADRQALVGVSKQAASAAAPVTCEARRSLNLLCPVASGPSGVKSVTLTLQPRGLSPAAIMEIALKLPAELDLNLQWAEWCDRHLTDRAKTVAPRNYADLCRVLTPVKGPTLTVTLDVPDLLLAAGEKLWVSVRANESFTLDPALTELAVNSCPEAEALPEYLPRLERLMRHLYSNETEANAYNSLPYANMVLYKLTERVLALDPANQPAQLIQNRMARRWSPVEVAVDKPAGAPEWAVWTRHAAREWKRISDWWLANRWVENGELGANLNDDVEYTCHWPLIYLISGDDRYRRAQGALADAVWEQSGGSGYAIQATDVEHAAEDASCSLPQMLLCEYGDPIHVERMMKMSEHIPFWTGINEAGRRQFRSYIFSHRFVNETPPNDIDHLYCSLAMCGATHLAWYVDMPQPRGWVHEYAQAWAAAAMSTEKGKPLGALPCDIHYKTSKVAPYTEKWNQSVYYAFGDYVTKSMLQGVQELVRDPALQPAVDLQQPTIERALAIADANLQRYGSPPQPVAGKPEALDKTWRGAGDELSMYRASLASGRKDYVVGCLKELAAEFERNRWLISEGEPITDRVGVPATTLLRYLYLGGDCAGKTHVPRLGLSWEGGGTDFAAFVLKNDYDSLKVLLYNFSSQPRNMALRTWKLEHGRYEVSLGTDADGDDRAESPQLQQVELFRNARLPFTLPAGRTMVLEAKQLQKLEPLTSRADLAVSGRDLIRPSNRQVTVTIHNIGAATAQGVVVQLQDATGKVLDQKIISKLEAPLDLKPRTAVVTLSAPTALTPQCVVVIDPQHKLAEIYEGNNRLTLGQPQGRFVRFDN